jgi:hypothetical protein
MLTKEQILGNKFEIWVEKLLADNGYKQVKRNVVYQKERYISRQVDVQYQDWHPLNSLVIVECKYSGRYNIPLKLRRRKEKAGQCVRNINDLVSEVEERRKFVGARKAVLVTNKYFHDDVYEVVEKYSRIKAFDKNDLEKLDKSRTGLFTRRKDIYSQIHGIKLRGYELEPGRFYL